MAPTAGCSRTKAAAGNIPRSGLWVSSSCICLGMARSRSDLDNEIDHEIRRLTFPTQLVERLRMEAAAELIASPGAAHSGFAASRSEVRRACPNSTHRKLPVCRRGVAEEDSPPVCEPTRFSESTPIPAPLVVLCRAENALRSQSQANVAVRRPLFAAPAAAIRKAKRSLRVQMEPS